MWSSPFQDQDGSGDIDKRELLQVIDDPDALEVLRALEVDVNHFISLQDIRLSHEPG